MTLGNARVAVFCRKGWEEENGVASGKVGEVGVASQCADDHMRGFALTIPQLSSKLRRCSRQQKMLLRGSKNRARSCTMSLTTPTS